jgi:hypothetical protein
MGTREMWAGEWGVGEWRVGGRGVKEGQVHSKYTKIYKRMTPVGMRWDEGSRPAHDIQSKVDPRTTDPSFEEHTSNKREWVRAEEEKKKWAKW